MTSLLTSSQGGIESVHVHLLAQTLKMQERFDAFEKGVTHLEKKTNEIVELVATRWEPSRDEKVRGSVSLL
jgi:hypothetical protein